MFPMDGAYRTIVLLTACNEALFRMICNISSEDGKYSADQSIGARHVYPEFAGLHQGHQDRGHARMEEAVVPNFGVRETGELRNGKVTD
jgi:hypothetical protein